MKIIVATSLAGSVANVMVCSGMLHLLGMHHTGGHVLAEAIAGAAIGFLAAVGQTIGSRR